MDSLEVHAVPVGTGNVMFDAVGTGKVVLVDGGRHVAVVLDVASIQLVLFEKADLFRFC